MLDKAALEQAQLLAESLKEQMSISEWFAQVYPLLQIMTNQNKDDVIQALLLLMGVPPDDVQQVVKNKQLDEAIVAVIMAKYMSVVSDVVAIQKTQELLIKTIRNITAVNDTNNITKAVKEVENSAKRRKRSEIFAERVDDTLTKADELGERVIWSARAQADGACRIHNGEIMTTEEFRKLYPIHNNCMCTPQLIPDNFQGFTRPNRLVPQMA